MTANQFLNGFLVIIGIVCIISFYISIKEGKRLIKEYNERIQNRQDK
jgi:hypothetical protein